MSFSLVFDGGFFGRFSGAFGSSVRRGLVYLFSSDNSDSLKFSTAFTGDLKVILSGTATLGINADVLGGLQGEFTASEDSLTTPSWNQFQIDAVSLEEIVDSSFNGVVGAFALDDVWYRIDMGALDMPLNTVLLDSSALTLDGEFVTMGN